MNMLREESEYPKTGFKFIGECYELHIRLRTEDKGSRWVESQAIHI